MELWILMQHRSLTDYHNGRGELLGEIYTDIESVCRALKKDVLYKSAIVSIEYANEGEKALIMDSDGHMFGAFKARVPMREDVPTKW